MTEDEILSVENTFAIVLPEKYRAILREYPFADDSRANEFAMPNDLSLLIDMNQDRSILKEYGVDNPSRYFQIGSDGGEVAYYIDSLDPQCAVYTADMETGTFTKGAVFSDWCEELRRIDIEIRRDQEEMGRKKWWQIWR